MNRLQYWLIFALSGLCSCATTRVVVERETGEAADAATIANSFAERDVVFLGEIHDSDRGHALQLEIVEHLAAKSRPLVISMEMFERDVQGHLDAYLAGKIGEDDFKKNTRPWPNYAQHYRPIVELARARRFPVIAANVPRPLASKVAREGLAATANDLNVAAVSSAPKDAYWQEFQTAIAGDDPAAIAAMGEAALYKMYVSQCLKDDTMAESIARQIEAGRAKSPRPLVVHLCGSFHSDRGYGTVARLRARVPEVKVGILSMTVRENPRAPLSFDERLRGDFVAIVSDGDKTERKKKQAKQEGPKHPPVPTGNPHKVAPQNPHQVPASNPHKLPPPDSRPSSLPVAKSGPETKPASVAQANEEEPNERPGLGLMPDYESGGMGMTVESVREGGPAAEAGILAGDTIIRFAGEEVTNARSYMEVLNKQRVGRTVTVEVLRDGKPKKLEVKIGVSRR